MSGLVQPRKEPSMLLRHRSACSALLIWKMDKVGSRAPMLANQSVARSCSVFRPCCLKIANAFANIPTFSVHVLRAVKLSASEQEGQGSVRHTETANYISDMSDSMVCVLNVFCSDSGFRATCSPNWDSNISFFTSGHA